MRINLVKVGNSKGIIIPAPLLASCGMQDSVELEIDGKKLVLAANKQPRAGWFSTPPTQDEGSLLAAIPLEEGIDEWQW
jgi:antitoxin MazE